MLAGLLLLPATKVARGGDDRTPQVPPFVSTGDLTYHVDLAAFRGGAGRTDQEVYIAIGNDQLAFRPQDDGTLAGQLLMEVVFRDERGDEAFRAESDLTPRAAEVLDAEDRYVVQSIRERAPLSPGIYRLEVQLSDRYSEKPGLLDRIRNIKNKGRLEVWVRVDSLGTEGPGLSDLVLVRGARVAAEGDAWARRGVDFDANPSRYYGLALPSVRAFVEVYGEPGWQTGDTYLVQTQVLDESGYPVLGRTSRAEPRAADFGLTDEIGLEGEVPAGTFRLAFTVMNERTRTVLRTERPFEVIWAVASWGRERDAVLQEMALVMTDSEYRTLQKLAPGGREVYLAEFWRSLDPDPSTPENPVLDEFRARVVYADRQYASALRRGVLTDRGRVYVRYGPPDDELYQFSSSHFGSVEGALEDVAEPGERATLGSRPSTSFLDAEEFRQGDVQDLVGQRGGVSVKSQQLLIWTYDGRGAPLRPDRQDLGSRSHRGLKFIFADAMGNGDFQVIGSSGTSVY